MTQNISEVVSELARVTHEEKELAIQKDKLRKELFGFGANDYSDKKHLLPTTTITVPNEFWAVTNMSKEEFFESRFPTWDVEAEDEDNAQAITTFVLRKNPLYAPFKYEDDEYRLSKTVTEPTPEIDFQTLKAEQPELFAKITKEVTVRELDGEGLEAAIAEDQEVVSILMRHTNYTRSPQQRVGIKSVE